MASGSAELPSRLGVLQTSRPSQAGGNGGGEEVEQPAPKAAWLAVPRGLLGPQAQAGQQTAAALVVEVKQEAGGADAPLAVAELPQQPAQEQPGEAAQQAEQQEQQAPERRAVGQPQEQQARPAQQRPARRQPAQHKRRRQQEEQEQAAEEEDADEEQQPARGTRYIGVRWSRTDGEYVMTVANVPNPDKQGELQTWHFDFPKPEPASECYDQAEIWKALRSGAELAGLRLNHPLSEYEAQPGLLARLAGLDYDAAWKWLVAKHNAARGQYQMSQSLQQPGREGQGRAAGRVVAGSSDRQLPPATAAAAEAAACACGAPGVFYTRIGQPQRGALPFLLPVPPPGGGASGSLCANSREKGIDMGRFFAKKDAQTAYDLCLCRQVALVEATKEQARQALLQPATSGAWLDDEPVMERLRELTSDAAMQRLRAMGLAHHQSFQQQASLRGIQYM